MTVLLSHYQYQDSRTTEAKNSEDPALKSDRMLGQWGSVEIEASEALPQTDEASVEA